jgi:hypothetical protein
LVYISECYDTIFSDDPKEAADLLREKGAHVFVVDGGGQSNEDQIDAIAGGQSDHVIKIDQWRGADSEQLGPIADAINKVKVRGDKNDCKNVT